MPDTDIRQLRQEVAHHPVYRWATTPADRTTLLVHHAFCRWVAATLARELKIEGPQRHLADTLKVLRRRGAGRSVESFLTLVDAGVHPVTALSQAGAPEEARPLVAAVWSLAEGRSEAAQLGAFALGLPCRIMDTAPAVDRLRALAAEDSTGGEPDTGSVQPEAEAAARMVLFAQFDLLQGALQVIRRRHMARHPSMWRAARPDHDDAAVPDVAAPEVAAPARLQLVRS